MPYKNLYLALYLSFLMLTDQCISVTDLKKNMNAYVKDLRKDKIIFVNNSPVAVLMDVKKYEKMMHKSNSLNIWVESTQPTRRNIKIKK